MLSPGAAPSRLLMVETLGSVLWLAMDGAWMLGWKFGATLLVAPALLTHLLMFRYSQRTLVGLAVVASVNGWLGMNAAWMLAELWDVPGLLVVAKILLAAALLMLIAAFSRSHWRPEARTLLFAGFRRLRVGFQGRPKE